MKRNYNILKNLFIFVLALSIVCLSCDLSFASSSDNEDNTYIQLISLLVKEFYSDAEPEIERVTPIYS